MAILSGAQIERLVKARELVIDPFDAALVQPATYDLRLGPRILAGPLSPDILGAVVELSDRSPVFRIQSGQMVSVLSAERLELPLDMSGRFGIRSEFARRGLNAFGGLQLDPGFRGRLTMNMMNVGPEPLTITLRNPLFSVEFQRLEERADVGYSGTYQDQDDFPQEQYDFILSARTTSLAEIPTLRQEVARLSVLVEELEEKLPDPDEGLELKPEVENRLRHSLQTARDSLLSVDEMRKNLQR